MEKNRSRFSKWLNPNRATSKTLNRAKSVFTKRSINTADKNVSLIDRQKCMSLDRMEIEINNSSPALGHLTNSKQIYSSLQPEIYNSLDSSSSDLENQSNGSGGSSSQQDLINIKKELILRTDTVTKGFAILEIIYSLSREAFSQNTEKHRMIERIFKNLRCMSSFHQLYQNELSTVVNRDLPLSTVFTNQIINSALNWYKIFYTSFDARYQLLNTFYEQDLQFKMLADEAIVQFTKENSDIQHISLPWILCSIKDSLFHFEVLLGRYSDCLDNNLEKSRINDAIKLVQNILHNCNLQCDYNDFIKTQQEYNTLSTTDPISPSVRFVHKGLVQKVCRQSSHIRQRMIFLFTHMIFITRKNVQFHCFKIKHQLNLSTCKFSIINTDTGSRKKRGFRLECGEFICEFLIEKEQDFYTWIEKLNSTICEARHRKNSFDKKIAQFILKNEEAEDIDIKIGLEAPSWQKPSQTNFCNGFNCTTRFNATLKRRHCSGDGLLYCENCVTFSIHISYSNQSGLVCSECYEILKNESDQRIAIERQIIKRKRIQRDGVIKGWLTVSKFSTAFMNMVESQQKLYCVLNSDCTIYTYELPEDKYHQLPIRVLKVNCGSHSLKNNGLNTTIVNIVRNGVKYSLQSDSEEEALKWIQSIKYCQLENQQF